MGSQTEIQNFEHDSAYTLYIDEAVAFANAIHTGKLIGGSEMNPTLQMNSK